MKTAVHRRSAPTSLTERVRSLARLMVVSVVVTALISTSVLLVLVLLLVPQTARFTDGARAMRLAHLAMLDQETSLRGFLITGQRAFLDPYLGGRAALPVQNAAVEENFADRRGGGVHQRAGHHGYAA